MTALPAQYAYTREGNKRVRLNTILTSFRGEEWMFKGIARQAYGNSSGRVSMARPCPDAYETGGHTPSTMLDCPHMWHRNGIEKSEFSPSVFELYLGLENGEEA